MALGGLEVTNVPLIPHKEPMLFILHFLLGLFVIVPENGAH